MSKPNWPPSSRWNKPPAPRPFKEGDLVVREHGESWCLTTGNVYRIAKIEDHITLAYNDGGKPDDHRRAEYFRHVDLTTDRDAINRYLLAEAGYRGFKLGVPVKGPGDQISGVIGQFFMVYPASANVPYLPQESDCAREEANRKGQPIVAAAFSGWVVSIDKLTIMKDIPIVVTVEGQDYAADFSKPDVVTFGCAQIDRDIIRRANGWVDNARCCHPNQGNRDIEGVQIGKGLFTRDLLKRLVERMDQKA